MRSTCRENRISGPPSCRARLDTFYRACARASERANDIPAMQIGEYRGECQRNHREARDRFLRFVAARLSSSLWLFRIATSMPKIPTRIIPTSRIYDNDLRGLFYFYVSAKSGVTNARAGARERERDFYSYFIDLNPSALLRRRAEFVIMNCRSPDIKTRKKRVRCAQSYT